ncbi:MAG: STAS domain-containing protein [Gemmatimonadales bacterium]|nr:STAS domain-containing protein [Gemmatimonadales bacterium]
MKSTFSPVRELTAPDALGLETRVDFRRAAIELLDGLPEGTGVLLIDLTATRTVDSAGLGALMLVQRRAAERRQTVVLRNANEELRYLLTLTKMDDLFRLESSYR